MKKKVESDYIQLSHERCNALGLSKKLKISKTILDESVLEEKIKKKIYLLTIAEVFMEQINDFYKDSNFFGIITDVDGCIISTMGNSNALAKAGELKMIPGAFMDEANIGTNAMSLVLTEGRPIQLSGEDHYIDAYKKWTCSAAPIYDVDGSLIGVIDITGYKEYMHPHTLGIVIAIANSIQKILEKDKINDEMLFEKKYSETIMDFIPAGILTSDLEGNIKSINDFGLDMFGFTQSELKRIHSWDLFDGWEKVLYDLKNGKPFVDEEVFVKSRKNKLQFSLNAYSLLDDKKVLREIILEFKDVKHVRKSANKIMGRRAIYTFDKIIGQNEKFMKCLNLAKKVADSSSTILITGESGTGKEIFAQSIQNHSRRKNESFVAVNCGAIPRNLIESELFGYEDGAFTGARKGGQPGKFEVADGGTLFLDEIGEMPFDMQTRLLRVIEEGVISRIGGSNDFGVNVRIIAATNKNLKLEVERGNFRKDLYYRLNVLPLRLPALKERKDDIHLFANYFMRKISKRLNKKPVEIKDVHLNNMISYSWPGNIREMENYIEHCINTEVIQPLEIKNVLSTTVIDEGVTGGHKETYNMSLAEMEKLHIDRVLKQSDGNITIAAKILGIGRNTLYRKLSKIS